MVRGIAENSRSIIGDYWNCDLWCNQDVWWTWQRNFHRIRRAKMQIKHLTIKCNNKFMNFLDVLHEWHHFFFIHYISNGWQLVLVNNVTFDKIKKNQNPMHELFDWHELPASFFSSFNFLHCYHKTDLMPVTMPANQLTTNHLVLRWLVM